ncbi:13091_t:CDS:2, partial [Racocetra persica]
ANTDLELNSGILIAVSILENEAAEAKEIHNAIESSLKEIANKEIIGKNITLYLLKRVNDITRGRSLKSNIALIKNNVMVGSLIAKCLAEFGSSSKNIKEEPTEKADSSSLLIFGGSSMDIASTLDPVESKNYSYYYTSSPDNPPEKYKIVENQRTAIYNAINDPYGQLICAVADMNIFD